MKTPDGQKKIMDSRHQTNVSYGFSGAFVLLVGTFALDGDLESERAQEI